MSFKNYGIILTPTIRQPSLASYHPTLLTSDTIFILQ